MKTREARTILGAAMIDDVLGLILLAIVSSVIITGVPNLLQILQIFTVTAAFFACVLILGPIILQVMIKQLRFLPLKESKLFVSFVFVMGFAWLATAVGLSSIIGAFSAGMILDDQLFTPQQPVSRSTSIHDLLAPFEALLAPLFFMLIGIQVKLETFFDLHVLFLAGSLLIAAIFGKLISGWGANRKDDRLLIGIGMLPRGEVGLVFASIGKTLGVINDQLFSAIILMVLITTLIAPYFLKKRYMHHARSES